MPGHTNALQINFTLLASKKMIGSTNILKCSRPASAWVSYAAVFNIPGGNACLGQSSTEMSCMEKVVLCPPVATVDEKDNWMQSPSNGHPHINELEWIRAISDAAVRVGWLPIQNELSFHVSSIEVFSRESEAGLNRDSKLGYPIHLQLRAEAA